MTRATFEKGAKIGRWEKKLEDPRPALKQIGALMVSESQASFTAQKFGGQAWEPRADVNVYGIISDFHGGAPAPPKRRFESTPVLQDTGRLKGPDGIKWDLEGRKIVVVGTKLPYAAVHQFGGEIESLPISEKVQRLLWTWLKTQGVGLKRRLGWLLNTKMRDEKLKGEVPARPFVGITKQTREDVQEAVGVKIMEVK